MSQSYRLKSKRANAISSCFASAAMKCKLNAHSIDDNGASVTAICLRSYKRHIDAIHAAFANCRNNL